MEGPSFCQHRTLETAFETSTACCSESLQEAVNVWQKRPNLVNRRLCGCVNFWTKGYSVPTTTTDFCEFYGKVCKEVLKQISDNYMIDDSGLNELGTNMNNFLACFGSGYFNEKKRPQEVMFNFQLRKLLPRSLHKFQITVELVANVENEGSLSLWLFPLFAIKDNECFSVLSRNDTSPWLLPFSYVIRYCEIDESKGRLDLLVTNEFKDGSIPSGILCANLSWLRDTLMPKLLTWSKHFTRDNLTPNEKKLESLSLVDIEKYVKIYNRMKAKYAQFLCDSWQENTDPQKFVFEDISIAAYLIVLWEEERLELNLMEKQSFVDLGCGNGLLVYLLSQEGYKGKGVDVRRRNIWDTFGKDVNLMEEPLYPNSVKFEDADWLIGNHSDELTPWIPVITARSSYNAKYFLLPCCFHDFIGKFQKNAHNASQYQTYLEYVKSIGQACGFIIEEDIQRIPSTKRICHIGRGRVYIGNEQSSVDARIQNYLDSLQCKIKLDQNEVTIFNTDNHSKTENSSIATFEPREAKEKVRNCTQVDHTIRQNIVGKVTNALLECGKVLGLDKDSVTSRGIPCCQWNCGGNLSLEDLVLLLDSSSLQKLKSQCGGLQTLLRNHGHIFKVSKGFVSLRNYKEPDQKSIRRRNKSGKTRCLNNYKKKLCWFHFYHPQGCLLSSDDCQFAHSDTEINA